jgi:signal transduction histidine kinase
MRHTRSIEWKLSLLIAGLLLATAGLVGAFAHRIATRSATDAVVERLRSVATQLGSPTGNSLRQRLAAMQQLADTPAIARTLMTGLRAANSTAVRTLLAPLGADTSDVADVVLRDRTGRSLFRLRPSGGRGDDPSEGALAADADTVAITPLFRAGEEIVYEVMAPVHHQGTVVGHLVQRRRITVTPEALSRLVGLVGFESTFLVGNADGSLWSDFREVVERPPLAPPGGTAEHYRAGDREMIRVAVSVAGTPLIIGIESPTSVIGAQTRTVLRPLFLAGLVIVMIGTVVGWVLGGRLTRPLVRLTTAAESIANGSAEPVPRLVRKDEIGRLSESIATMAERLRGEQSRLEAQVAERTAALSDALDRLRTTQEELVRKERFAILGHLSSGVGHELRNPLGVMTNAIYFLTASLPDAPPKVKEYFGVLRDQIRLSEKIVSDLLDFARVKPPEREVLPLGDILDAQLGRTTVPATIRLERDLASGLPPVDVDAVQVGQVVLNMIINAVQAIGDAPGVLRMVGRSENGSVILRVEDTGPGIRPDHLEQVFEPLFTTKARGIGLGLSVSRALATNNDAVLTASNVPGGGACFTLVLPRAGGAG